MKLPSGDRAWLFIKQRVKKAWEFIKQRAWYIILLVAGSSYVWHYRFEIYQFKELNARNLIFILWLLLLFWPLISEMEFLGVKVKKEVEKATEEVRDNVHTLQTQIAQLQMSNTVANNISFGNPTLPSEQKLEELLQIVRSMQAAHSSDRISASNSIDVDGDKNVYLFKVRLEIERTLRELCEKTGHNSKVPAPIMKMLQTLNRAEIINGMTCDLISQVSRIANRGVHGEIISDEYITFVQETYPEIMRQLKEADSRLKYMTCPRCKYSGYSTNENVCPQCGYISDDD